MRSRKFRSMLLFEKWRNHCFALFAFGSALALAGCATVTFKRGASPDTMATDERACRDSSTDEVAYVECMRERGWFIARTDEASDRPAADVTAPPQGPDVTPGVPARNEAARPALVAPTPPNVPANVPPTIATVPELGVPANAAANAKTIPPAAAPAPAEPLPRVDVASWWKLGGSAADLDRAIDSCVGELGAPHRPDAGAKVVTTALRSCLRARGWYAFGGSGQR